MESHAIKPDLMKREPPPGVHVILGDSAAGTFKQAFRARDRLLIDQDVLSCGPTPTCESFEAWSRMRLGYWNNLADDDREPHEGHSHTVPKNLPQLREAERINIWFATSLSEQLFVAFTLNLLDEVARQRVYLVPFEGQRGRSDPVRGLGQLDAERMMDHPEPAPLTHETREDYRAAWTAITSDDPHGFERFASDRPNASAWLKRAMTLMLRRFPDRKSGLVYWDRVLLSYAREEPRNCARIVGETMGDHWDEGDFVGDSWLFTRLLRMARLPSPLLEFTGNRANMRETEAVLTRFGRDVREGRASNYPTNPIEDWAAGVKLSSSAGNLWFNDGGVLVRG